MLSRRWREQELYLSLCFLGVALMAESGGGAERVLRVLTGLSLLVQGGASFFRGMKRCPPEYRFDLAVLARAAGMAAGLFTALYGGIWWMAGGGTVTKNGWVILAAGVVWLAMCGLSLLLLYRRRRREQSEEGEDGR